MKGIPLLALIYARVETHNDESWWGVWKWMYLSIGTIFVKVTLKYNVHQVIFLMVLIPHKKGSALHKLHTHYTLSFAHAHSSTEAKFRY